MKVPPPTSPSLANPSALSAALRAQADSGAAQVAAAATAPAPAQLDQPAALLATAHAGQPNPVADIGAALKAESMTATAAVDQVIERVLVQHLGSTGSVATRREVEAALRDHLAEDPLLAAKVRALSQP